MKDYNQISESLVEYKGVMYRRYPESKNRTHRVYYQHHGEWKKPPVFLHRKIYEDNFGPIPKGHHVHHKDNNPDNNSPDNLEALPMARHMSLTSREMWGNSEWAKNRREYYRSEEHKKKTSEAQMNRKTTTYKCQLCGESFTTRNNSGKLLYCPECRSMKVYSRKKGESWHFNETKQKKRFGKVLIPYENDERRLRWKNMAGEVEGKHVRCIETGEEFVSVTSAAKKMSVGRSAIREAAKNNTTRTCKTFHWEFVDNGII